MKLLLVLQVVWCLPDANCTGTRRRNAAHSAERECCPEVGLALGRRGFRTVRPQIRRHALGVGWNSFGQQGDGTTNNTGVPHQVLGAGGVGFLTNLSAILGGETHNAALRADGTVWDWGRNFFGELMMGPPIGAPYQILPRPRLAAVRSNPMSKQSSRPKIPNHNARLI